MNLIAKMSCSFISILFLASTLAAQTPTAASTLSPRDIVKKTGDHFGNKDELSRLEMTLTSKSGSQRVRKMTVMRKSGDDGNEKTMIRFQEPSDIRGTSLLTLEQGSGKDSFQWIYLPSIRKAKQIAGGAKGDDFVGSDFAYEDLQPEALDNFQYTMVQQDDGHYVIDATPKTGDSSYSRRRLWIRKDNYFITKVEYFDKKGQPLKTMEASNLARVGSGRWRADTVTVRNSQTGHSTTLKVQSRQLNSGLTDDNFTKRALQTGV